MNDEVPGSTPALVNKEHAGSNPAMICANSDGQLATAMLGVQVTCMDVVSTANSLDPLC